MGDVVKFKAQQKEYPISIQDIDGEKWVTAQQFGEAIGVKGIRRLIRSLKEVGEIKEEKHCRTVSVHRQTDGKMSPQVVLSYRGVIRIAMRAQSQRARAFRDWAEDVLLDVMVTGQFGGPENTESIRELGVCLGIEFAGHCQAHGVTINQAGRLLWMRRQGLTQEEAGAAIGIGRNRAFHVESAMKKLGIDIPKVDRNKRIDSLDLQILFGLSDKKAIARL